MSSLSLFAVYGEKAVKVVSCYQILTFVQYGLPEWFNIHLLAVSMAFYHMVFLST